MELEQFGMLLGSALGGGGIVELVNWRINRKKGMAEAKGEEIENLRKIIDSVYQPIIQQLNERISQVEGEMRALQVENMELRKKNAELQAEVDKLRDNALFRNTVRGKDGKFAKSSKDGGDR